jgi:hypothetical protein
MLEAQRGQQLGDSSTPGSGGNRSTSVPASTSGTAADAPGLNGAMLDDFGGVDFDAGRPQSHWTCAQQFYTWWKNNVERKSKFRMLKIDACYLGDDETQRKRCALYTSITRA